MWSASAKQVPRQQIIETAFEVLAAEQAAIFYEGPSPQRVDEALAVLALGSVKEDSHASRIRDALFHPSYDAATRFRATDEALRSWKRSFGCMRGKS